MNDQFSDPSPVEYVKKIMPHFGSEHRVGLCYPALFNYWIFGTFGLGSDGKSAHDTQRECEDRWSIMDKDRDGSLNMVDINWALKEDERYMHSSTHDPFKDVVNDARSFMRLHDMNHDNTVDREEFMSVCVKLWNIRMHELAEKEEFKSLVMDNLSEQFMNVDQRDRGFIDKEMYEKAFPESNLFEVALEYMDQNRNGRVEVEEYQETMNR